MEMAEEYGREYFESYVERYKASRYDLRRMSMVLSWLAPQAGDRVLDLGCGVGEYSSRIRQTGAMVTSVDFSAHALAIGRQVQDTPSLVQADACRLPFGDELFNKVIAVELIEHVENQDALFSEFSRVLASGGLLLLTTSPIASSFFFAFVQRHRGSRLVQAFIRPYDVSAAKHVRLQHPRILVQRLRDHGFEVANERYWNAFHLSYFLSRTSVRPLRRTWRASCVLDRVFATSSLCNDVVVLAKKNAKPLY